jgi:DNA-binding GntR family transcriptional regulator
MFKNIKRSLRDLLGAEYMNAVKSVAVRVNGMDEAEADALINEEVEFLPQEDCPIQVDGEVYHNHAFHAKICKGLKFY